MAKVVNILTRHALVKRTEKLLAQVNEYFADTDAMGLSSAEADPDGQMAKLRKGLMSTLANEARLKAEGKI